MKPLAMDFVAASGGGRWGGLILLIGLALSIATGAGYWRLLQDRLALEQSLELLSGKAANGRGIKSTNTKLDDKMRAMDVVAERISVPWERLFQDIESCDTPDVALLQFQPNITQHQVTLMGEARDRASVENYIRRLERTPSLEGVHLAQHNQAPESGPWAIRYALTAKWTYEQP